MLCLGENKPQDMVCSGSHQNHLKSPRMGAISRKNDKKWSKKKFSRKKNDEVPVLPVTKYSSC